MKRRRQKKRLEAAVQAIQGKWGNQALHKGVRPTAGSADPVLPTGLAQLDRLLGDGGLPLGHISELIGQSTSGKRTLALHLLARTQQSHPCIYLDLAQTFDPAYAAACRVNLSSLTLAVPADPVQALDLACDLAAGGHFGLIIFDSTAELRAGTFAPGAAAAVLRRLRQALAGRPSALLFLTTPFFDRPEAAHNYPHGFDLGQAAALRLLVGHHRWLYHGETQQLRGYEARVTVLRSRRGRSGGQALVQITFNGVHVDGG